MEKDHNNAERLTPNKIEVKNNVDKQVQQKKGMSSSFLVKVFFVGCIFLFGVFIGHGGSSVGSSEITQTNADGRADFGLFWKAWDKLQDRYVDQEDVDPQQMIYGAIKGMFASTGDPYTTFFDPEVNKAFEEELRGSFEGIGAEIGLRNNLLTIISPLDDSPAQKAGLRAGDSIIQIDGQISAEMSIEDAVKLIRGEKGSTVILTIFREGENDTRDISVERDTIEIKNITIEPVVNGIGFIRVSQFGNDTDRLFREKVQELKNAGAQKYIIDLRNNPGGILGVAIQMISVFVKEGSVAVIEETSGGKQKIDKTSRRPIVPEGTEIVVLINQGSASASEIFAGALKAHLGDNVTLVGTKTFGKGSVQELIPMQGGTAAKITIAKWLTPDKKAIDGIGIEADIQIEFTDEDYDQDRDPQRDTAQRVLEGTYDPEEDLATLNTEEGDKNLSSNEEEE